VGEKKRERGVKKEKEKSGGRKENKRHAILEKERKLDKGRREMEEAA
jgi:hypothetical protein